MGFDVSIFRLTMSLVKFILICFRIDLFRESGIYEELIQRVLNPRNTPVFDKRVTTFTNEYENITITQINGLFLLLLISIIFLFILLFFENLLNFILGFVLFKLIYVLVIEDLVYCYS